MSNKEKMKKEVVSLEEARDEAKKYIKKRHAKQIKKSNASIEISDEGWLKDIGGIPVYEMDGEIRFYQDKRRVTWIGNYFEIQIHAISKEVIGFRLPR